MLTPARRRLLHGLVGLCVLAFAGLALPGLAVAVPTSPSPLGPTPEQTNPSPVTSYQRSDDSFAVSVSPARLSVPADGLDTEQRFTVVNRGQEPVSLTVQKRNFVSGPDGGLTYLPDAPYGAAEWVHVTPTRLTVQPGTSELVNVGISVPAAPEPGDHQVALVFLTPATGSGNVRVNRGIGTPVFLTVPGPTDDSVRLNSLTAPGWSWTGDPTLTASLTSTGTVHRDFRGPTALAVGSPNHPGRFSDFTVSRGSDRVVSTPWDAPLVCVCRPSVTVTDADGVPQTLSTRVVVLPWWMLAGVLLIVVVGSGVVLRSRNHAHRRTSAGKDAPLPS